jgi:hypothetical protein
MTLAGNGAPQGSFIPINYKNPTPATLTFTSYGTTIQGSFTPPQYPLGNGAFTPIGSSDVLTTIISSGTLKGTINIPIYSSSPLSVQVIVSPSPLDPIIIRPEPLHSRPASFIPWETPLSRIPGSFAETGDPSRPTSPFMASPTDLAKLPSGIPTPGWMVMEKLGSVPWKGVIIPASIPQTSPVFQPDPLSSGNIQKGSSRF